MPVPAEVPSAAGRVGAEPLGARPWWAWLIPDLSLVAAGVALFHCLVLFDGTRGLFRDSDTGWHIRNGEDILGAGRLPQSDPYSFTRQGQAWFAWEWGTDVLMGAAHRLGGAAAVAWLYAVAIAACVWLWFRLHWAEEGNFFLACAMAWPMLTTTSLHWLARPHVLSWLLLLVGVWRAERISQGPAAPRFGWRQGAGIFVFGALWANLHGSFFLAPAIAVLYAAAHLVRPRIWELEAAPEHGKARWFAMAAATALLGSLVNPYGWRLHRHLLNYLADTDLLAHVGEFQSFNFHAEGALPIVIALGLAAWGAVLALAQRRLAVFGLLAALLVGALRSARGLPLVALLALPLANGALSRALGDAGRLRAGLRHRLDGFLDYSERLRALDGRLGGVVWIPVGLLVTWLGLHAPAVAARAGFPPEQFPVAAAAALQKLPPETRLLAPDKYGGYLIYRFQGRRKVFFDGRSDLYGAAFMRDYIRLMQVRPGWQAQVEAWGFTHALLPNDYSLAAALEQLGWRRLYRDQVATLLEKPAGAG